MSEKIKISNTLFNSTLDLLESLDVDDCTETMQLYGYVLHAFKEKKAAIAQREALLKGYNGHARHFSWAHGPSQQQGYDEPF